jgi:tRNA1Val (adenine37-N6)-methyltransferase
MILNYIRVFAMLTDQEKPFRFKQFDICHSRSAMKVGTDAVLLAAWAHVEKATHILDVGAGTGLIAIMCAQRNQIAFIDAIEIDEGAAQDARENIERCPWRQRLKLHEGDYLKIVSEKKFDLIISNPPYFSQSLRASNPSRNAARHDDSLPMEAFLKQSKRLLDVEGTIALVLPIGAFERWTEAASTIGLHVVRICHVYTSADKQATRVLLELKMGPLDEPEIQSILIQGRNGEKSESYKELTWEFYTKW